MFVYVICTLCSVFCIYLATRITIKHGSVRINNIFILIAIFLPCFFAAVRASSVGTDVLVYGDKLFLRAQSMSFVSFLNYSTTEINYKIVTYLTALTHSRCIYYFVLQMLVVVPFCAVLLRKENRKYAWFGMLLYFFWIYGYSYNLMRQIIAVAIMTWGTKFLQEKKIIKYLVCNLVAIGFHYTAVIALLFIPISFILSYDENKKGQLAKKYHFLLECIILAGCLSVFFALGKILEIAMSITGRYDSQITHMNDEFGIDINYAIFFGIIICILYFLMKTSRLAGDSFTKFVFFIIVIGFFLYQLKGFSSQLYRVSLYCSSHLVYLFPKVLSEYKGKQLTRDILIIGCILVLCVFVYYYYVKCGWNGVYPYEFY